MLPRSLHIATAAAVCIAAAAPAAYSNPFCAYNSSRDSISVGLACAPGAGVITAIQFAAYGTPDASGPCGTWKHSSTCDQPSFLAYVQSACLNQPECAIFEDHSQPDPCVDVIKAIAVQATCSSAPGGSQIPAPAPLVPVPSCATQDGAPPCPLPQPPWQRSWQLNRSTICQPGNTADFLDPVAAARFGLVSLD